MLRLFDLRAVEDLLARANGRRGAGVLCAVLAELAEPALTRSDLEEEFLGLCRAGQLARPEVNVALVVDDGPPIEVDFLWRAQRLAWRRTPSGPTARATRLSATGAAISASSWPATIRSASPAARP